MFENLKKQLLKPYSFVLPLAASLVISLPLSPLVYAAADDVAMVWQLAGKHSFDIAYSNFVDGQWTQPVMLTENKLNDATPAIVSDAAGNQWVMWSEAGGSNVSGLKYRVKDVATQVWSDIKPFDTGFAWNSMPSLLRDKDNQIWCFWSSVDENDDEIYYSRFVAGKWQKPLRIYAEDNKVPDILAQASVNNDGKPSVNWQGYDLASDRYRNLRVDWNGKAWSKPRYELTSPFTVKTLDKKIAATIETLAHKDQLFSIYDRRRYPFEAYYFGR